jgi:hypothetical protein
MAEDLGGVLREVSALLQRLTEQNDAATRQREEDRSRWQANRGQRLQSFTLERPDPNGRAEEMRNRMEESRALAAKYREEDVQFRQKLLHEIERHNQLLETLIAKLVAGTEDS